MQSKREQAIDYLQQPGDVRGGNLCTYALAALRRNKLGVYQLPLCEDERFSVKIGESIDDMRVRCYEGCVLLACEDVHLDEIAQAKRILQRMAVGIAAHAVSTLDTRHQRRLVNRAVTGSLLVGDIESRSKFHPSFDPCFGDEKFYGTAQGSHYETTHPRYFPAVAIALVSDAVTQRILCVAPAAAQRVKERAFQRRDGCKYPTANFYVD